MVLDRPAARPTARPPGWRQYPGALRVWGVKNKQLNGQWLQTPWRSCVIFVKVVSYDIGMQLSFIQNGRHFADYIFKHILWMTVARNSTHIYYAGCPIDDTPALVRVMVSGTPSHQLNQWWSISLMWYGVMSLGHSGLIRGVGGTWTAILVT